MSTTHTTGARTSAVDVTDNRHAVSNETKPAFKTTELIVYVASVLGVLIASLVTDVNADGQGFGAKDAWLFVTLLTIGYMVSRGLAKSGSRNHRDA